MTGQEFNELKKNYTLNNCSVTRIAGCYVNGGEKEIKSTWQQAFLSMEEEDMLKYLEIFRKVLSGKPGKTMYEIPVEEGKQRNLQHMTAGGLKNGDMPAGLFQKIINSYEYVGNYLILAIHNVYDVPGVTGDGAAMEDASGEIYEYILCCICPANLQKSCLAYDDEKGKFTRMERDWILKEPAIGFLYPAFNGRTQDNGHLEYFLKKAGTAEAELAEKLFGYTIYMPEGDERKIFCEVIKDTLGVEATLEQIQDVEENLREYVETINSQEDLKIGKEDVRKILQHCDLSRNQMYRFDGAWDEDAGEITRLSAVRIVGTDTLSISTKVGTVKIAGDYKKDVSVRTVNDRKCLVIDLNGKLEVNGIEITVAGSQWEE